MKIFSRTPPTTPPPAQQPKASGGSTPLREYSIQALPPHRSISSRLRNAATKLRQFSFQTFKFSGSVRHMQTAQGASPQPRLRANSEASDYQEPSSVFNTHTGASQSADPTYQDPSSVFNTHTGASQSADPTYQDPSSIFNAPRGADTDSNPVYQNTSAANQNAEPAYQNIPAANQNAEPVYQNVPGANQNADPVHQNVPGEEQSAEPFYEEIDQYQRVSENSEPIYESIDDYNPVTQQRDQALARGQYEASEEWLSQTSTGDNSIAQQRDQALAEGQYEASEEWVPESLGDTADYTPMSSLYEEPYETPNSHTYAPLNPETRDVENIYDRPGASTPEEIYDTPAEIYQNTTPEEYEVPERYLSSYLLIPEWKKRFMRILTLPFWIPKKASITRSMEQHPPCGLWIRHKTSLSTDRIAKTKTRGAGKNPLDSGQ